MGWRMEEVIAEAVMGWLTKSGMLMKGIWREVCKEGGESTYLGEGDSVLQKVSFEERREVPGGMVRAEDPAKLWLRDWIADSIYSFSLVHGTPNMGWNLKWGTAATAEGKFEIVHLISWLISGVGDRRGSRQVSQISGY